MNGTWLRRLSPALLLVLSACSESDADTTARAVEAGVQSFFVTMIQWMVVMFLLAGLAILLWSLLIGGAVTAFVAGRKRVRDAEGSTDPGAPPTTDPLGMGMMAFGGVLLLLATGTVCASSGTTGTVSVPLPLILLGIGLVWAAKRRRAPATPPAREDELAP